MAKNLTTGLQRGLRQSIAGGLGTGDLFSTASLDLQFARHKSLDSRVTHTRQSSATYVDGDGVIRTAVTNLLLQSEDFSTTWVNANSTESVNVAVAPDGSTTADKIVEDTSNSSHFIGQQASFTSGIIYTASVFAKKAEHSWMRIGFPSAAFPSDGRAASFDLNNGVLGTVQSGVTATVTSFGDGWYRCSITATADATVVNTANGVAINPHASDSATSLSYTGDGTSGIYLWGAQLEQSSTVGQYVKTTTAINSAPRFDHDPETGESLGLLVEESRQNLLLQSEDLSTTWTNAASSEAVNVETAPNGTVTADKLIEDNTTNDHYISQLVSGLNLSLTYVFSVYLKAAERNHARLRIGASGNFVEVVADLASGTLSTPAAGGTGVVVSSSIISASEGWYRVSITGSSLGGSGQLVGRVDLYDGTSTTYLGDGTSGIYIWGAQLEAGSFPTSYIPTEGSTVTRAADVASITGTNFSSWYEQSEGTVFADFSTLGTRLQYPLSIDDGSTTNFIAFGVDSSNSRFGRIDTSGVTQAAIVSGSSVVGASNRAIIGYFANNIGSTYNGTTAGSDLSASIPTVNRMTIGSLAGSSTFATSSTIRRLTYWPTRLSNDTLQTITA